MNITKRQITNDDIDMLQARLRADLCVAYYHETSGLLHPFNNSLAYQKVLGWLLDISF